MNAPLSAPFLALLAGSSVADESDYYAVDYLVPPDGAVLEVGGMDFLRDGRLIVSTRRGEVWIVTNPLAEDPAEARFSRFAEGLWGGLGLKVVGDDVYVVQRGELSRLRDEDGDGRCDRIDAISTGWGLSGNYHEYAFGLPVDDAGDLYVSLNVSFLSPKWWHGQSSVPWRGWVLEIAPDGTTTPVASGFRSPCGLGRNGAGDLFVTDNQGDWVPAGPIFHLQEGRFYGHPASLAWTDEYLSSQAEVSMTVPPPRASDRAPAAVWLPYKWSRSAGNLVHDPSAGAFGPFEDQLFVAELTNGLVVRTQLEKVRGEYQGACFLFRQEIGSVCRVAFASDGTLFCGLTNRGWGGFPPADGIARVRWTGRTPMEMRSVHLLQDGFDIEFTLPVAGGDPVAPADVELLQYDYDYWWEYGSPERHLQRVEVTSTELSEDRRHLVVRTAGLTAAMVARVRLFDVVAEGGEPLLHDEFAYTINQLPEGAPTTEHVVKVVPPPPARETSDEGWLRLTWGDALDAWESEGWALCDAELDREDPRAFRTTEGVGALVNTGGDDATLYVSKPVFGDVEAHLEFMLPEEGMAGVWLMGRYRLNLSASESQRELTPEDCGGLPPGSTWNGRAPAFPAFRGPGQWHSLDLIFRAPRFDEQGNKIANARFERVLVDDTLLHEGVEVPEPSDGGLGPEVELGPLVLDGRQGPIAFGNVRAKPLGATPEEDETGWAPIFNGEDLEGWTVAGEDAWEVVDGVIVGTGGQSHLFSPRDDYTDFDLRARIKINAAGNSGLYFRTTFGPGWPEGYEAQINSSYPDPQKTGSLYGLAPVHVHLVPADTWFDYHVRCREEDHGTRVTIRVNGVLITDYLDGERRHGRGHVALQQHHEGSVVEISRLEIRE